MAEKLEREIGRRRGAGGGGGRGKSGDAKGAKDRAKEKMKHDFKAKMLAAFGACSSQTGPLDVALGDHPGVDPGLYHVTMRCVLETENGKTCRDLRVDPRSSFEQVVSKPNQSCRVAHPSSLGN